MDTKLTTGEILDLVGDRLADEEVYNDGRRVAQQAYGHSANQTVQFSQRTQDGRRRSVQSLDAEDLEPDHRVAVVE